MDGSRFDAWTRRRFGAAVGGLAGSLLALSALPGAEAKKKRKKRKKRCTKLGRVCKKGAKRKCCKKLKCREVLNSVGFAFHCCKANGAKCSAEDECCSGFCDSTCKPNPL